MSRKLLTIVLVVATMSLALILLFVVGGERTSGRGEPAQAAGAPNQAAAPTDPMADPLAPVAPPLDAEQEAPPKRAGDATRTPKGGVRASLLEESHRWLTGQVSFPEGTPSDERVFVLALKQERSAAQIYGSPSIADVAWGEDLESDELIALAAVEEDGSFQVSLPREIERAHLALTGRYHYSPATQVVKLPSEASGVVLRGQLGAWITGKVTLPAAHEGSELEPAGAETSKPGILLELGPDLTQGFDTRRMQTAAFEMKTSADEANTFTFRAVPCTLAHGVLARHESVATHVGTGVITEPGQHLELEIALTRGASLTGRVVDEEGKGIAGAEVSAYRPGQIGEGIGALASSGTDAAGAFELAHVTPGKVELKSELDGYRDGSLRVKQELFDGRAVGGFELVMKRGSRITGRVIHPDGSPVAGAAVNASIDFANVDMTKMSTGAFDASDGGDATTDEAGEFSISGLGDGAFRVIASSSVGAGENEQEWHARRHNVHGGDPPLELVLELPLGLVGRVVSSDGQPVPEFTVQAVLKGSGMMSDIGAVRQVASADEEEEGRFELDGLFEGEWKLSARADGFSSPEPRTLSLPRAENADELTIELQPGARVTGIVLDSAGAPVPGAQVTLKLALTELMAARQLGGAPSATAGADGRFELEGLDPGSVALVAAQDGFAESEAVAADVLPGETVPDVVLVLRMGGTLTGEVLGADGDPAVGRMIVVQRMPATGQQRLDTSDAKGTFRMEHLEPGKWQVIAMRNVMTGELDMSSEEEGEGMAGLLGDMEFDIAEILEGGETHVVLGKPSDEAIHLEGRVTAGGEGVDGAVVSFVPDEGSGLGDVQIAVAGKDGSFQLDLNRRGSMLVTVQRMRGMGQQNSIEFREEIPAEGERHRLELELPEGKLGGRVLGPDGKPLASCRITLNVEGGVAYGSFLGGQYSELQTGEDGRYEISNVRAGSYSIAAGGLSMGGLLGGDAVGGRMVKSGIRLEEGEAIDDIDFRLSPPGVLAGVVLDASGGGASEATVFVRDEGGRLLERFSFVTTDSSGRFSYAGLAPGRYAVMARRAEEASPETSTVMVVSGETSSVQAVLTAGTVLRITVVDKEDTEQRARIRVVNGNGAEVSGMLTMEEVVGAMGGGFADREQRVGPLPPGTYEVTATLDDGREAQKTVRLTGQAERPLTLRVR